MCNIIFLLFVSYIYFSLALYPCWCCLDLWSHRFGKVLTSSHLHIHKKPFIINAPPATFTSLVLLSVRVFDKWMKGNVNGNSHYSATFCLPSLYQTAMCFFQPSRLSHCQYWGLSYCHFRQYQLCSTVFLSELQWNIQHGEQHTPQTYRHSGRI